MSLLLSRLDYCNATLSCLFEIIIISAWNTVACKYVPLHEGLYGYKSIQSLAINN